MIKLSGIIIVKNSEAKILECIKGLAFCDEILVVDNGSNDKTVALAKEKKAKVVSCESHNFSDLRTIGKENAKGEWLLYVDVDERVSKQLQEEILRVIRSDQTIESAFTVGRKNYYFGSNAWPKTERLERLFKKSELKGWVGKVHETPIVSGHIGRLSGKLLHYSHQDLSTMLEKTRGWSTIEAELRFTARHPRITWWRFPRVMLTAFLQSYVSQQGWRVGTVGLLESLYQAFSMFITYAKLWEMQQ